MRPHVETSLEARFRHYQTTGGRNACAVLSSQSATISFESLMVPLLSLFAAAASASANFSNALFHSVRLCRASATRRRAVSSAKLASAESAGGVAATTDTGALAIGVVVGAGSQNAQLLSPSTATAIANCRARVVPELAGRVCMILNAGVRTRG